MTWTRVGSASLIVLLTAVVALLASCDHRCFCQGYQRSFGVVIIDGAGDPVTNWDYSVTVESTGQPISLVEGEYSWSGPNEYVIVTDMEKHQLDGGGDRLHFVATNGEDSVTADYEFDVPGDCHCHLRMVSGPDSLVIHVSP